MTDEGMDEIFGVTIKMTVYKPSSPGMVDPEPWDITYIDYMPTPFNEEDARWECTATKHVLNETEPRNRSGFVRRDPVEIPVDELVGILRQLADRIEMLADSAREAEDELEERAAILEYDGNLNRKQAEAAAQAELFA